MSFPYVALASLLTLSPLALAAQAPAPATPAPAAPSTQPAPSADAATTAYAILQPALVDVQNTLSTLKIDKWKRGSVRDEAGDNVKAILQDLQNNLPPLVTAADAAPGSVSQAIPLVKHLGAVYDVLLRVEEASRVSAPSDQVGQLEQVLKTFEKARLALDDHVQQNATEQEKKITELQASLTKAQDQVTAAAEKPAPKAEPCKPAPAVKKKHHVAKPAQPTAQQPAAKPPATTKPQ